jgi:predicted PurR-regulated permease PerM
MKDEVYINRAIATAIRIGFIALLLVWCFKIIEPFVVPVLWGIIIAAGVYPFYKKLASLLGNKEKLAATLITIFALALLIIPSVLFTETTISGLKELSTRMDEGTLTVPPPAEEVADWPVIGKSTYEIWKLASVNIGAAIEKLQPMLEKYAPKLLSAAAGLGFTFIQFLISIIIAGALLVNAKSFEQGTRLVFKTLIGGYGEDFTAIAGKTIRSVVQGVLGVAIIQSILGGIGILAIGISGAGLWALIILFLAIIQLPPVLVLGPLAVYAFTIADTTPAAIFLVWSILVSGSDTFLKPLFLGRGVDIPMLVILLGAIGGMILSGIIGLFVGAVVLALGYKVFQALINVNISPEQEVVVNTESKGAGGDKT